MRKLIVSIGVVMLVIILPAGSWYYLQTGLDYRKAILKELKPLMAFDPELVGGADLIRSRTTLLQIQSDEHDISRKIYDQFGKAETFTLWSPTVSKQGANWIEMQDSTAAVLTGTFPDASFLLLDTAMQIRHVYKESPESVVKDLIAHIAIVLPRKKDKDIKMKNSKK